MLTKDQITHALRRLSNELEAGGLQGEILLTGGAAMCLIHSARDMTKDIDALYEPKDVINELVVKIAREEGLPEDWLNDGVKGFLSPNTPREDFLTWPGLKITTVAADYLLAMKLMSARYGATDYDDIRFLVKELGITSAESMIRIVTRIGYVNGTEVFDYPFVGVTAFLAEMDLHKIVFNHLHSAVTVERCHRRKWYGGFVETEVYVNAGVRFFGHRRNQQHQSLYLWILRMIGRIELCRNGRGCSIGTEFIRFDFFADTRFRQIQIKLDRKIVAINIACLNGQTEAHEGFRIRPRQVG